jgi:hypothetical protein
MLRMVFSFSGMSEGSVEVVVLSPLPNVGRSPVGRRHELFSVKMVRKEKITVMRNIIDATMMMSRREAEERRVIGMAFGARGAVECCRSIPYNSGKKYRITCI